MDVSAPSTSPELSVAKFFERHFAVLELRILVIQTLGEGLHVALPCDGVSSVAMAVEAARLFGRHGAIDAKLFDTLLQHRPRLSHEIDKLRHECLPAAKASDSQVAALSPEEWEFQGRDDEICTLRHILLEHPPGAAAVLGPAGIGKSAFTLHVLHDPAVRGYYGTRRWFVRLDAAPSTEAAVQLVAVALGLRHDDGDAITAVCLALGRQPGVLVLDNLETPWELDRGGMEAMLRRLCAVEGLALVASVRGTVSPGGLSRPKILRMVPLATKQTSALFLSIAPEHEADPRLARLLEPLGGVPLAVVLLARVSLGNDLGNVEQDWAQRRTEILLELGPDHDRLTSWAVSLELSWQGRRMNAAARLLASLVALFPDGLAHEDLSSVMAGGPAAATVLVQVGLSYFEAGRLRMLAPVREHLQRCRPPSVDAMDRACEYFAALARELGPRVGERGGAAAAARLTAELANIDVVVRRGLVGIDPAWWIDTACALTGLARFAGEFEPSPLWAALDVAEKVTDLARQAKCHDRIALAVSRRSYEEAKSRWEQALLLYRQIGNVPGEAKCLARLGALAHRHAQLDMASEQCEQALRLFRSLQSVPGEALCLVSLGHIAFRRSRYGAARENYEQALILHRTIDSMFGEANCLLGLGDIAYAYSEHGLARENYIRALPLFREIGDLLGEANCIKNLGDIALERGCFDEAGGRYEHACVIYRRINSLLGEANCIKNQGDIALERTDVKEARRLYEQALPLFRVIQSKKGEAHCFKSLGDIALRQDSYEEARVLYESALQIFQDVGSALGQGNCIRGLGRLALRRGRPDEACKRFAEALLAYETIPEPRSMGYAHVELSRLTSGKEQQSHIDEARRLWAAIDRPDLVATI